VKRLQLALRDVGNLFSLIFHVFPSFLFLQADQVTECTEPNPAIWALRPDHEKLRNGHVSVVNIIIVIIILKFHQK
jgi:hypothetical protein